MPHYSEWKVLIWELQFLLVTTLENLEMAKWQYRIFPPCLQSTLLLLGLLGILRKTNSQPEGIVFLSGIVLAWHSLKTQSELWKNEHQNIEHLITYSQAHGILDIDHVCCKRYLQKQFCWPRIASLCRTFEVFWITLFFQRWARNHSCLDH